MDLSNSFLIGDAISDSEAVLQADCLPILVKTRRGSVQNALTVDQGYACNDLPDVVCRISREICQMTS